jgi:hypothetical protein
MPNKGKCDCYNYELKQGKKTVIWVSLMNQGAD